MMIMNNNLGIYVHIPFCVRRCPYCDFYSCTSDGCVKSEYVNALIADIKGYKDRMLSADSVYFGGGTPTSLTSAQLVGILSAIKESFSLSDDCEITTEANPCTVDFEYLCEIRKAGFNRISFGVQSAVDSELLSLGRLHSYKQAENAVLQAKKAGFDNISCDLMIGVLGQTSDTLAYSVDKLCSLPITHISAYMLKIEDGTPYDCDRIRNSIASDDTQADFYLSAVKRLAENGFEQYEISNFCKNGRVSRHNMKYWELCDYIGFGPSAHSFFDGKRFYNERDVKGYITDRNAVCRVEDNNPDALCEYTMLSLRLSKGISREKYVSLGGSLKKLDSLSAKLVEAGLAKSDGDILSLTPEGFLLSNSIILELL